MKGNVSVFVKGLIVGGSMTVPGVSGGTMAILLNIYDQLIEGVNNLTKRKWESFPFLLLFALGGGLGIILIAQPLSVLIELYRVPVLYFFMGAVIGGIPPIYKKAEIKKFSWKVLVYPLLGAGIVASMTLLERTPFNFANGANTDNFLLLFLVGIFIAAALVLPGISGSFMLLVLGLYDQAVIAASDPFHHLPFIIPLALGALLGIFLTTGILEKLMTRFPQGTYLMILGFVIGSLFEVWPGVPSGIQFPISIGLFTLSLYLLSKLSKLESTD